MRRPLRIALIVLAAIVVVLVGAGAVLLSQFDPNSYKPQIEAAVKRATGRDLALNGKIGLALSLTPTIAVQDVAFANPPGFSRPQMATLQSVELRLALLPLLSRRIQINSLVLNHPDILLETNAAGAPNWRLTPEVSPEAPAGSQAPPSGEGRTRTEVSVESVVIQDGTIAYRDGRTGKVTTLGLPRFRATAASPDAPLHIDADATDDGHAFSLVADTGSLTRLQDPAATTPWPVKLTLTAAGAHLTADGALAQPMEGKGYTLAVSGAVPDATALRPFLTGIAVPPLRDVTFAAKVADTGAKLPAISALTLHVGASDLGARVPGLSLDALDVAAPAMDQPAKVTGSAKRDGAPVALAAVFSPPAALLPGAKPAPFALDATVQAVGATATVKGSIANASAMQGVNLALGAQVPDLAALGPLIHQKLPGVKTIAFQGTLSDAGGGFRRGAALRGTTLTSSVGDLAGDMAFGLGGRPVLTAVLRSNRIDADAIQTASDQMQAQPAPAPAGAKPPAPPKSDQRLFSDKPVPFALLRLADADVTASIGDLRSGGADYRAIAAHAVLKDGRLSVDPFQTDLPGGHLNATLQVDASKEAPPVHLILHAPGLALRTILQAVHEPSYANGNLEVYADLRGTGDSSHALAASLDGSLGIAMAGGTIDNRLLGSLLGKVMDSLNALDLVGKGGDSNLRCFAMRMEARNGVGRIEPLALSSSLLTMTGSGTVNLGPETLALQLRPQARVGGTGLVIPVNVAGPIRNPSVEVNKLGAAETNAGTVAGAVIGNATPLGIVGGLLGADKLVGGGPGGDICPAALAAARGHPISGAPPPPARPAAPSVPNPATTLRNLFR